MFTLTEKLQGIQENLTYCFPQVIVCGNELSLLGVYMRIRLYVHLCMHMYIIHAYGAFSFSHSYESKDIFLHIQSIFIKFRKFSTGIILLPN